MLHVKLKNLKENYKISYEDISQLIMEAMDSAKPKNIIVPSFTYSFAKKNKFNVEKTKSSVESFLKFSDCFIQNIERMTLCLVCVILIDTKTNIIM